MKIQEFADLLKEMLEVEADLPIETFEARGLLTRDTGLIVNTPAGDEFQITIVQTREGQDTDDDLPDRYEQHDKSNCVECAEANEDRCACICECSKEADNVLCSGCFVEASANPDGVCGVK